MLLEELTREWQQAGIQKGDTVLLHSNLRRTLKRYLKQQKKITPQIVLDSFLEAVGSSGTLILPLFNFDFTDGVPFDYNHTPSQMGALTEIARKHPLAIRTGHPVYSFSVIGYKAERFRCVDNFSAYGKDSPFAILREQNGKIAVLNLPDQNSMTFYHHVEEMNDVSYRFHKIFSGEYTDSKGKTDRRKYSLFVRDIEKGVLTDVNPMGELVWEEGLYTGSRYDQGFGLRVVSSCELYEFASDVIQSGRSRGLLYSIEGVNHE